MSRRRTLTPRFLAAGAVAAACGVGGPAGVAAARPLPLTTTYPSHLLVYAQEWSLWPSRTTVPAGTVDVQLWNRGEDSHDLRIRRVNRAGAMVGAVIAGVSVTPSGKIHSAVWHLRTGRYELYCSLPGHLMMGMHATIRVTV